MPKWVDIIPQTCVCKIRKQYIENTQKSIEKIRKRVRQNT